MKLFVSIGIGILIFFLLLFLIIALPKVLMWTVIIVVTLGSLAAIYYIYMIGD